MTLPWPAFFKNRLIWAIGEAERLKGAAPYTPEVLVVYNMNFSWTRRVLPAVTLILLLQDMYREDRYYADKEFTVWSLNGPDGSEARKTLETYSERFRRMFPGCTLDATMHVVPLPTTPCLNLK